ncbi:MAG: S-layer homology domain-containing protein [Aminobacterium sp.]|jgi:hypothetical protein|nr:S-layer homology domain-containing protein [Aminobacterium sp.]MDD3708294.1 S-layer homology domain-containing protein [Aminobacterium sp.]MDD4552006.1 S-layer homology domain-containing protein [Aminobacterium sp.]
MTIISMLCNHKKKIYITLIVFLCFWGYSPSEAQSPFTDLPEGHWAYDAIHQLASAGIIKGYPDHSLRGDILLRRYEVAEMLAKTIDHVDIEKIDVAQVIALKKLLREFQYELTAIPSKTDLLDKRITTLEENIGNWRFWGTFQFDGRRFKEDMGPGIGTHDFRPADFYLWFSKIIDSKTTFVGRLGHYDSNDPNYKENLKWDYYWIDLTLPRDFALRTGRWYYDWEAESQIYTDADAFMGDTIHTGYYLTKNLPLGQFVLFVAHDDKVTSEEEQSLYGIRWTHRFDERFRLAINGLYHDYFNDSRTNPDISDWKVAWLDFEYALNFNTFFRGAWYVEDLEKWAYPDDQSPQAWKAILDIKQEQLKLTNLWIEYAHFDKNFKTDHQPWNKYSFEVTPHLGEFSTNVFFIKTVQDISEKWTTFQRYANIRYENTGGNDYDTTNWSIGVRYHITPSAFFELLYDDIHYGNAETDYLDNNMWHFRTEVNF